MKILYLVTQAEQGGAQKYVLAMANHFHGVVASGSQSNWLFQKCADTNIKTIPLKFLVRDINPVYDLLALIEIIKTIRKEKSDLVHANSSKAGVLGSFAGFFTSTPVIFTAHGFAFLENKSVKSWLYLVAERIAARFRKFTITVSDVDRAAAIKNNVAPESQLRTIHNGIPNLGFLDKTQARSKLGLDPHKFIVGTIANLYHNKGIDVLVESAKLSGDKQFVVIGNGPEKETLIRQGDDKIIFKGSMENASTLLKAFDVFVLPSRKEGLPFVLLEAMQAGLPIIASDVGGIREALGGSGIVIAPENPKALHDAIMKVKNDLRLGLELSQKAKIRSKNFSEAEMFAKTGKIYSEVV